MEYVRRRVRVKALRTSHLHDHEYAWITSWKIVAEQNYNILLFFKKQQQQRIIRIVLEIVQ